MATKIRGLTIEIGGDASGLEKSLKKVNSEVKSTEKELKDVEKLLKFDPTNTELLAQKQKLLADKVSETSEKLETLKKAQKDFIDQGGDVNSSSYMALQREIIATEQSLKQAKKDASEFNANLVKVEKTAKSVAEKTKAISTAAFGIGTAIVGIGLKSAKTADELNTLSKQSGISTEELQKFQYASNIVDVSVDDIVSSLKKMKKNMSSSSSEVQAAWKTLGVSVVDTNGELRDSTEVFYEVIEALGQVGNETQRDTLAMSLFGRSADSLAGIVDDGGKALKELGNQAQNLGLVLGQDTLDSMNAVNDQMDLLKANLSGTLAQTGATALEVLAPIIEDIANGLSSLLEKLRELSPDQLEMILGITTLVALISPMASIIGGISSGIGTLSGIIAKLSPMITSLFTTITTFIAANPITLVIAAVVAAVALIYKYGDEIKTFLDGVFKWINDKLGLNVEWLKNILFGVIDFIQNVFKGNWKGAWDGIVKVFTGIWQGILAVAKAPLNGVIDLINLVISSINFLIKGINALINVANKVPGVNIGNIGTIGKIPMLANGGVVSSGSAIVGEAGAELLTVANGKAQVQPLTQQGLTSGIVNGLTPFLSNGCGETTINLVVDGQVIAKAIYNPLQEVGTKRGIMANGL